MTYRDEKKPVMAWLWPDTHQSLKAQARKEGCSIGALINRLVSEYLKKVNR